MLANDPAEANGRPEDVAAAVRFLASEEAGIYHRSRYRCERRYVYVMPIRACRTVLENGTSEGTFECRALDL